MQCYSTEYTRVFLRLPANASLEPNAYTTFMLAYVSFELYRTVLKFMSFSYAVKRVLNNIRGSAGIISTCFTCRCTCLRARPVGVMMPSKTMQTLALN